MLAMDSSTVIGTGMPARRADRVSFPSAGLSHMTGDIDAVGRQQTFLPFAFRAGFKAFAMMLRAGIAVVLKQRDGIVDLFARRTDVCRRGSYTGQNATAAKVLFLPHRQLVLLRQTNGDRRANLFAAAAEDAASEVKLPSQLAGFQIRFHRQGIRRTGVDAGRTADALLRVVFRLAAEVLSTGIGSSG